MLSFVKNNLTTVKEGLLSASWFKSEMGRSKRGSKVVEERSESSQDEDGDAKENKRASKRVVKADDSGESSDNGDNDSTSGSKSRKSVPKKKSKVEEESVDESQDEDDSTSASKSLKGSSKKKSKDEDEDDDSSSDLKSPKSSTKNKSKTNDEKVESSEDEANKSKENEESESDEDDENHEVEAIVDHKVVRGQKKYKVHWKGYPSSSDTWEAESNLNCPELIEEYLSSKNKANGKKAKDQKRKSASKTNEESSDDEEKPPSRNKGPKKGKKAAEKKASAQKEDSDDESGESGTEEFEVERIVDMHTLRSGKREFLVRWKGWSKEDETWEPESHLEGTEILKKFLLKVNKAKESTQKELRVNRKPTDRYTLTMTGLRKSSRYNNSQRPKFYEMC